MTLAFRNVELDPALPIETWPAEALATAIERGSLLHWRRISAAIQADPWGPVARTVEQLIADGGPYGVGPGLARVIAHSRARWEQQERQAVADELRGLLAASELTAGDFAGRLGTSASRMSTYLAGRVIPSAALMVRARRIAGRGLATLSPSLSPETPGNR